MYETLRIRATVEAKAIYQKVQAYSHKARQLCAIFTAIKSHDTHKCATYWK